MITKIALGELEDDGTSIIKHCCDKTKHYIETQVEKDVNGTLMNVTEKELYCKKQCKYMFELEFYGLVNTIKAISRQSFYLSRKHAYIILTPLNPTFI